MDGRTTLVIAHRPSANQILVIENGRIALNSVPMMNLLVEMEGTMIYMLTRHVYKTKPKIFFGRD